MVSEEYKSETATSISKDKNMNTIKLYNGVEMPQIGMEIIKYT